MESTEREALRYQLDYLLSRQGKFLAETRRQGVRRILLLFEPVTTAFQEIGLEAVTRILGAVTVDVIRAEGFNGRSLVGLRNMRRPAGTGDRLPGREQKWAPPSYDLSLVFVQDPAAAVAKALLREARRMKARRTVVIDCNFNAYRKQSYWMYRLRSLLQMLPLLKEEPGLVWRSMRTVRRVVVRDVARKLGLWDRWEAAVSDDQRAGDIPGSGMDTSSPNAGGS